MSGSRQATSAFWISMCVAVAVLLRLAYLGFATSSPGFEWVDPDHYLIHARLLAGDGTGWSWSLEAVRFFGPFFKAPLYQVFVSLFVSSPFGYEWSVAVAHAALGGLAVAGLWSLGRDLHSPRCGWIAAIAYAVYFPAITSTSTFMQEQLYIPLLILAFAALARALATGRTWAFGLAGALLGAAALTRSMPIYFAGPAAALLALQATDRRLGAARGAIYLASFLVLVVPYSLFISSQTEQFILVENIGAFQFRQSDDAERAPVVTEVAAALGSSFRQSPGRFLEHKANLLLGSLQLGGGRWLQISSSWPTAGAALGAKAAVHVLGDAVLMTIAVAGPLGFAVARQRPLAGLLGLWILIHLAMTVMSGYAGQRFRGPVDWTLIVLAACLLSGAWHWPRTLVTSVCVLVSGIFGWSALSTADASLEARADYGTAPWVYADGVRTTTGHGDAGFNMYSMNGALRFRLVTEDPGSAAQVRISVDGVPIAEQPVGAAGLQLAVSDASPLAFVDIEQLSRATFTWSLDVFDVPARPGG